MMARKAMRATPHRWQIDSVFAWLARGLAATLLCMSALPAHAAGVVGNGTAASCTTAALASAITAGSGTITFNCGAAPVSIVATPGGFAIATGIQLTIDGGNKITLSGGNGWRVFVVDSGGTLTVQNLAVVKGFSSSDDGGAIRSDGTLNVTGCTFSGNQTADGFSGGAILSYGPLTISNSAFSSNQAGNGGAIYPRFAAAVTTITDTTFDLNVATNATNGWGGAMLLWDGAPVTLTRAIFHDNTARALGGAILVEGTSVLQIHDSQFYNNSTQAVSGQGGAIYNQGTLRIYDSTLHTNHANSNGGAIFMENGITSILRSTFNANWAVFGGAYEQGAGTFTAGDSWFYDNGRNQLGTPVTINGGGLAIAAGAATIADVTVSNNYADAGGGLLLSGTVDLQNVTISNNLARNGAGIFNVNGNMTVTNVTVYQNLATNGVGGIAHSGSAGMAVIRNTIVANNSGTDPDGSNGRSINCDAPFTDFAFDLSTDGTCGFGAGRDNVADMQLMPLANAGGYAPTHVPLATSPAVDNASNLYCPSTDQRGVVRAGQGTACDVGSVEYVAAAPLVLQSVVSRKTHGAAGTFDLGLGLVATNPSTEPRAGGAGGNHTVVFTFDQPLISGTATISAGAAVAGVPSFSGNSMIVPLSGVSDQQYVTVGVSNVLSSGGGSGSGSVRIGFLVGDVNQSRVVTLADLGLVNAQLAQPVSAANFLKDVNAGGTLTLADKGITNANLTKALPAP